MTTVVIPAPRNCLLKRHYLIIILNTIIRFGKRKLLQASLSEYIKSI